MSTVRKTIGTITDRKAAAAMTLVEVLVVIAIIAILTAILLPSRTDRGGPSFRTKCLSNLKQLDLGLLMYGQDNRDRLPTMQASNWLWDLPLMVADSLRTNGSTRDMLYDPGQPEQNDDAFRNFGLNNQPPYRVIGYAMTFPGTSLNPKKQNFHIYPDARQLSAFVEPPDSASQRALAAGVVISQSGENNTNQTTSYHWTDIPNPYGKPVRSSHLDRAGKLPVGDNVAMLDGSARWVKFSDMKPRTQSGPVFWW